MKQVIQNWDIATWHTDILWNTIHWTIMSDTKMNAIGKSVSRNNDVVFFANHPHDLDIDWNPINYRSHNISVIGTSKVICVWERLVVEWDKVPVSDEAGWDAYMQANQYKLFTN